MGNSIFSLAVPLSSSAVAGDATPPVAAGATPAGYVWDGGNGPTAPHGPCAASISAALLTQMLRCGPPDGGLFASGHARTIQP
jgi:hypothetical protein